MYDYASQSVIKKEQYFGTNVDDAYDCYEYYQKRYTNIIGWCKTQTTDWHVCWKA